VNAPDRPPFKVSGIATIKHLNVRKEGPDDEKIIALDVKLDFEKLDWRICLHFDDALPAFLWRIGEESQAMIARSLCTCSRSPTRTRSKAHRSRSRAGASWAM
jgi:hypothetical protein